MAIGIQFDQVAFRYNSGTPFEFAALHDISVSVPAGKVTAIIGHTGSGKSTFIQHLNVLVKPTEGTVTIGDLKVNKEANLPSLKPLRKKIGVVFQFPEAQLFEETVLKDVMFGPLNFGVDEVEAERIAREKLDLVGIAPELFERSPFELSGGQMRRVAIAGVLALEPEVLVLDEPTAGLDPLGQQMMLQLFVDWQKSGDRSLILISHHMEDVAKYAEHVIVLEGGTVIRTETPQVLFADVEWLRQHQLDVPHAVQFLEKMTKLPEQVPLTVEALADYVVKGRE